MQFLSCFYMQINKAICITQTTLSHVIFSFYLCVFLYLASYNLIDQRNVPTAPLQPMPSVMCMSSFNGVYYQLSLNYLPKMICLIWISSVDYIKKNRRSIKTNHSICLFVFLILWKTIIFFNCSLFCNYIDSLDLFCCSLFTRMRCL